MQCWFSGVPAGLPNKRISALSRMLGAKPYDQFLKILLENLQGFYTGAPPRSTVGSASDSRARGPGFDTRPGHILSFLLPLIQEGQLSITGERCARSTG